MRTQKTVLMPEASSGERPALAGRWNPQPGKARPHYHDNLGILWNRQPMALVAEGRRTVLKPATVFLLTLSMARTLRGYVPGGLHGSRIAIL